MTSLAQPGLPWAWAEIPVWANAKGEISNAAMVNAVRARSGRSLVFIWWFASGFSVEVEGGLSAAARTFVGKFGRPIAGHAHLDLGAILAGGSCALNRRAFVHLHARHIHVDIKFDVADFDELAAAIAKFDQHIVVTIFELPVGRRQFDGKIVHGLRSERCAGHVSAREFVPRETRAVNQPNRDEGAGDDSWQMMPDAVRWYQRRRHNWRRLFFSPIRQFASSPDDIDHGVNEQLQDCGGDNATDHRRGDALHDVGASLHSGRPHDRQ